jgi:hypothetical protein
LEADARLAFHAVGATKLLALSRRPTSRYSDARLRRIRRTERVVENFHDLERRTLRQRVVDRVGLAASRNEAGVAEDRQVLRKGRLAERNAIAHLADRQRPDQNRVNSLKTVNIPSLLRCPAADTSAIAHTVGVMGSRVVRLERSPLLSRAGQQGFNSELQLDQV